MKFQLGQIKGRMGRVDPRGLPPGYGQIAENIWLGGDDMRPLEQPSFVFDLARTGVNTMYRFGQALNSPTQYWFSWTQVVDVVKGAVAGDINERTFWTGEGAPRFTTTSMGTGGSPLPSASRLLALPGPTAAPVAATSGTGTGSPIRRVYVYTFINEFGDESVPSATVTVDAQSDQAVLLTGLQTTTSNGVPQTGRRVYRADAGTLLFAVELNAVVTSWTDTLNVDALGPDSCPSINWDPPIDTLAGLTTMSNGILVAFSGSDVYFSEPDRPYAWPQDYRMPIDYPVVALAGMAQSVIVLTTGAPVILSGIDPGGLTEDKTKFKQPCASKRSVVSTGDMVLYASPEGLCSISPMATQVLTAQLFSPEEWAANFFPSTIVGAWYQGMYIGTYFNGTVRKGFTFNPTQQVWIDLPTFNATGFYRDTVTDALYCTISDDVYKWRGSGTRYTMKYRSGIAVTDYVAFNVGRVDLSGGSCTVKVYGDGVLSDTSTVSTPLAYKLDTGQGISREWEIEISSSTDVRVRSAGLFMSEREASREG